MGIVFYELLTGRRPFRGRSHQEVLQQIIHAEFTDPDLSVDRIADQLNYHRGSMSRAFHRHTGVTIRAQPANWRRYH